MLTKLSSSVSPDQEWEQQIAEWVRVYKLNPSENERLVAVLDDYEPADVATELPEELKAILAARKLSAMETLTPEIAKRIVTKARRNGLTAPSAPND